MLRIIFRRWQLFSVTYILFPMRGRESCIEAQILMIQIYGLKDSLSIYVLYFFFFSSLDCVAYYICQNIFLSLLLTRSLSLSFSFFSNSSSSENWKLLSRCCDLENEKFMKITRQLRHTRNWQLLLLLFIAAMSITHCNLCVVQSSSSSSYSYV